MHKTLPRGAARLPKILALALLAACALAPAQGWAETTDERIARQQQEASDARKEAEAAIQASQNDPADNQAFFDAQDKVDAANASQASAQSSEENAKTDLSSSRFMFKTSDVSIISSKDGASSVTGGGVNNINALAAKAVRLMLVALSILCTCVVVAGGLTMAVSAGNEERVTLGKNMVTYSLLGLFVALASYSIIALVGWGLSPA